MEAADRLLLDQCIEKLKDHDEYINGNGKPGAKQESATTNLRLTAIEKRLDQLTTSIWGLVVTLVGAILTYLVFNVIPHVGGG